MDARTLRNWKWFLLAWGALVVAIALAPSDAGLAFVREERIQITSRNPHDPLAALKVLAITAKGLFIWVAMLPLIVWLGMRFRFERRVWWRHLALHAALSFAISWFGAQAFQKREPEPFPENDREVRIVRRVGTRTGPDASALEKTTRVLNELRKRSDAAIYWLIIGGANVLYFSRQAREREKSALELAAKLSDARLQALRGQLQPHFLFNALNAVSALIARNTGEAQDALNSLAELLRASLNLSNRPEIPLREELDFVEKYLAIQKIRFGDSLEIVLRIAEETRNAMTPPLALQPLVENSIKHGLERSTRAVRIDISAARHGEILELIVADNGPGALDGEGSGVGLENLRARLAELYPGRHELCAAPAAEGGFRVAIKIPFRVV